MNTCEIVKEIEIDALCDSCLYGGLNSVITPMTSIPAEVYNPALISCRCDDLEFVLGLALLHEER